MKITARVLHLRFNRTQLYDANDPSCESVLGPSCEVATRRNAGEGADLPSALPADMLQGCNIDGSYIARAGDFNYNQGDWLQSMNEMVSANVGDRGQFHVEPF